MIYMTNMLFQSSGSTSASPRACGIDGEVMLDMYQYSTVVKLSPSDDKVMQNYISNRIAPWLKEQASKEY